MSGAKISLSLAGARKPTAAASSARKRRHATLEQDDEEDEPASRLGRAQTVSHFDRAAGGAVDENAARRPDPSPLVIPKQSNRDWRQAALQRERQRNSRAGAGQRERERGEGEEVVVGGGPSIRSGGEGVTEPGAEPSPQYGLITAATRRDTNGDRGAAIPNGVEETTAPSPSPPVVRDDDNDAGPLPPQTDDELALAALLGHDTRDTPAVIAPQQPSLTETDAFRHDYADAPDMATLDDYARVPVEQFGAALLRGMGWKDGEGIGSQRGQKIDASATKLPQRRAALLGIGAKEDATVSRELGAWGKAAKGSKEVKIYNPVLLKDKRTGKMFTEDELKEEQQRAERKKFELEFERKERERDARRGREQDDEKTDRARYRDSGHRHDRDRGQRRDGGESNDEYSRRREKPRRRRREWEERGAGEYDRDRDRSHRHRDYKESDDSYDRERSNRHGGRVDRGRDRPSDRSR